MGRPLGRGVGWPSLQPPGDGAFEGLGGETGALVLAAGQRTMIVRISSLGGDLVAL